MAVLDLNLRPAVASKALEWCRERAAAEDRDRHPRSLSPLSEDIARLKAELRKIEPFSRDLSSVVAVVTYVIKHLEAAAVEFVEGDATDMSSDVEEDGRGRTSVLRRWCDGHARAAGTGPGEAASDREDVPNEIDCSTALVLGAAPLHPSNLVDARVASDRRSFGALAATDAVAEQQRRQTQSQHVNGARRKRRRCWSRELHRRFVDALEKLGGPQVATPKQIRERMKVSGLTNDEVKSHLQKYRLRFKKKPSPHVGSPNRRMVVWGATFSDPRSTGPNGVGELEVEESWAGARVQRPGKDAAVRPPEFCG